MKITFDQVKELIPDEVSLTYVDRDDSFDNHTELLQEAISEDSYDGLSQFCHDIFMDSRMNGVNEELKVIEQRLRDKYFQDVDDAMHECHYIVFDLYRSEIDDELYDRDTVDPMIDMILNTGTLVAHYDTGYYMESESWNWPDHKINLEVQNIKNHLNIKTDKYDSAIDMMVRQATYGGSLLIYFDLDFRDFMDKATNAKSISFKNYSFGIVNHDNGSGDTCDIDIKEEVVFPFNRKNVFLEKSIKYNWTYSIAGMISDWASRTVLNLSEDEAEGRLKDSSTNDLLDSEREFNEAYQGGSCSRGDMDINRHRKVIYINDFPCGNKCQDCGTFWID